MTLDVPDGPGTRHAPIGPWRVLWRRVRWRRCPPPTGVTLILTDHGRVGPLPLRYQGRCGHGHHQWVALAAIHLEPQVESVTVDTMPLHADLLIAFMPNRLLGQAMGHPDRSSR